MIKNPFTKSFEEQINSAVSIFQSTRLKLQAINANMQEAIKSNVEVIRELEDNNAVMLRLTDENDTVVENINKIFTKPAKQSPVIGDLFDNDSVVISGESTVSDEEFDAMLDQFSENPTEDTKDPQ